MKKKTLLLTLASSTLLLSSCGKVVAQFPDGDSPLTNATIQLDHNTLNVIYDSIKNSDNYESDVNSILTSAIAKEVIGDFKVIADEADGYRIVLDGYDINFSDNSEVSAEAKTNFIKSHPAYYNWETSGYRLTLSESAPTKEEFEPRLESIKNIIGGVKTNCHRRTFVKAIRLFYHNCRSFWPGVVNGNYRIIINYCIAVCEFGCYKFVAPARVGWWISVDFNYRRYHPTQIRGARNGNRDSGRMAVYNWTVRVNHVE